MREPEGSAVIEILEQYNTSQAGDCLGTFLLSDISPGSAGISANCLIFLKYILSYIFFLKNTTFSAKILYCCTSNRFFQYSVIRCL